MNTLADMLEHLGYGRPGVDIDDTLKWVLVELDHRRRENRCLYLDLIMANEPNSNVQHLYQTWSEDCYAAGWMCLDDDLIHDFAAWLRWDVDSEPAE